jgi:hypothetical protein
MKSNHYRRNLKRYPFYNKSMKRDFGRLSRRNLKRDTLGDVNEILWMNRRDLTFAAIHNFIGLDSDLISCGMYIDYMWDIHFKVT